MSLLAQLSSLTLVGTVFIDGWNAQNFRPLSMSIALGGAGGVAGVGGADLDPLLEVGGHIIGELLLRRHFEIVISLFDGFEKQAAIAIAGDDCRPGVAPFADAFPGIEPESSLDLLGGGCMAGVAFADQNGADTLLEEGRLFRRGSGFGLGLLRGGRLRAGELGADHPKESKTGDILHVNHRTARIGNYLGYLTITRARGVG